MKHQIFYTLFLCILATTCAQANEAKRIADAIAPMMNETIAAVAHVDLDKINPDEIETKIKPILLEQGPRIFFNFDKQRTTWKIKQLKESSTTFLATAKTLQVRDVYFLVKPSLFPYSYGYYVVPFENEAKAKAFVDNFPELETKYIQQKPFPFKNYAVILAPGMTKPNWSKQTETMTQQIVTQKTSPRPELLAVLEEILQNPGTSAAQLVVIPSAEMRYVYTEMTPILPEPLEKFPTSYLTRGIQWGAVSLDFAKPELRGVIRSENPQAAKDLRNIFEFLLQRTLDGVPW